MREEKVKGFPERTFLSTWTMRKQINQNPMKISENCVFKDHDAKNTNLEIFKT